MNYYDDVKNVEKYIRIAQGYDGRELIKILKKYLPQGSSVLELGMGPGKDLNLLNQYYQATGSDSSQIFLDKYKEKHKTEVLLLLDARTIETVRKFDCIYSNKVLHHLSEAELRQSFSRQRTILNPQGLLAHSFWYGEKEEFYDGLRFRYYTEEKITRMLEAQFEVWDLVRYSELEEYDSFFMLLKIRQ